MTSKSALFVFMALGLTFSVSCTPDRQRGTVTPKETAVQIHPPNSEIGTADSGGGNLLDGKPLESYIKDITKLPSYQEFIKPIYDGVRDGGNTMVYFLFRHMITKKTWYFVPVGLEKISALKIGSAVDTDQGARQDFDQVWIDNKAFEAMESIDQAKLILHEILIGIRLLRLDSPRKQAEATAFRPSNYEGKYAVASGKPSDLTPKDYADVRRAGAEIMINYKNWNKSEDWEEIFWKYGFSFAECNFRSKDSKRPITVKEIQERLTTAKLSGSWPKYNFSIDELIKEHPELIKENFMPNTPVIWKSNGSCTVDVSVTDDRVQFDFSDDKGKVSGELYFNKEYLESHDFVIWGDTLTQVHIQRDRQKSIYKQGDTYFEIRLNFEGYGLSSVDLEEVVCVNSDCSSSTLKTDNRDFRCSSKDSITIKNQY